ncbi:MAG TPA: hypothetical protein PKY19_04225, partial [Oscillospiraceae bacterium]|nr:hypothetical protein [Oscillospiraceae bacterium]
RLGGRVVLGKTDGGIASPEPFPAGGVFSAGPDVGKEKRSCIKKKALFRWSDLGIMKNKVFKDSL